VRLQKAFLRIVVFVPYLLCFVSCQEKPCLVEPETYLNIGFYSKTDSTEQKNQPLRLSDFSLRQKATTYGVPDLADTFKIKTFFTKISIRLPENDLGYWLSFRDSIYKDSVFLTYKPRILTSGESCGFYYGFEGLKIDSVFGDRFKSGKVIRSAGDSTNEIHVKIFW